MVHRKSIVRMRVGEILLLFQAFHNDTVKPLAIAPMTYSILAVLVVKQCNRCCLQYLPTQMQSEGIPVMPMEAQKN